MIHTTAARGIQTCKGFILAPGAGVKDSETIGLITLFSGPMPVWICGVGSIIIPGLMVSALGIRLRMLSMENGQINLTATNPQRSTLTHLGAFFKISLRSKTASTSQPADMLILTIIKKNALIVSLLSGYGRSCAALRPILRWRCPFVL